jgi:hypothetical protein
MSGPSETVVRLCWLGALIGALAGGFVGYVAIGAATGAPQEAAGAAMGCLIAMVPYVFARSIHEILRD